MPYFTAIGEGNSVGAAQQQLNDKLSVLTDAKSIEGCGIGYGKGDNHVSALVWAGGSSGSGKDPQALSWVGSSSKFDDLANKMATAMTSMGTLQSFRFTYASGKWRALVTYLVEQDGFDYKLYWRSDSSQSRLESEMSKKLADVDNIFIYDYAYGDGLNAAMAIGGR